MGIDVGTYETKGVLVNADGAVVATEVQPHTIIFPRAGWAEHDAEGTWWEMWSQSATRYSRPQAFRLPT
jgi:xylulokinase